MKPVAVLCGDLDLMHWFQAQFCCRTSTGFAQENSGHLSPMAIYTDVLPKCAALCVTVFLKRKEHIYILYHTNQNLIFTQKENPPLASNIQCSTSHLPQRNPYNLKIDLPKP